MAFISEIFLKVYLLKDICLMNPMEHLGQIPFAYYLIIIYQNQKQVL